MASINTTYKLSFIDRIKLFYHAPSLKNLAGIFRGRTVKVIDSALKVLGITRPALPRPGFSLPQLSPVVIGGSDRRFTNITIENKLDIFRGRAVADSGVREQLKVELMDRVEKNKNDEAVNGIPSTFYNDMVRDYDFQLYDISDKQIFDSNSVKPEDLHEQSQREAFTRTCMKQLEDFCVTDQTATDSQQAQVHLSKVAAVLCSQNLPLSLKAYTAMPLIFPLKDKGQSGTIGAQNGQTIKFIKQPSGQIKIKTCFKYSGYKFWGDKYNPILHETTKPVVAKCEITLTPDSEDYLQVDKATLEVTEVNDSYF